MSQDNHNVDMAGFQFFGMVCASISHEIKNALAIINENAGLLQDLIGLTEKGNPPDPERLKKLAGSLSQQVQRADGIVQNMNQFAHSVDQYVTTVELNEILQLLVALSGRFAAMRRITLNLQLPENPLRLKTSPFFMMNLIWCCLDFAMNAAGNEKIVEIVIEPTDSGAQVGFRRLENLAQEPVQAFPTDCEKKLLHLLKAEVMIRSANKEMIVKIAADIDRP